MKTRTLLAGMIIVLLLTLSSVQAENMRHDRLVALIQILDLIYQASKVTTIYKRLQRWMRDYISRIITESTERIA